MDRLDSSHWPAVDAFAAELNRNLSRQSLLFLVPVFVNEKWSLYFSSVVGDSFFLKYNEAVQI